MDPTQNPSKHPIERIDSFLHTRDRLGQTPLHRAVEKNDFQTSKRLLEQGANPNQENDNGDVPLHSAAHQGHLQIIKALIERGAIVDRKNAKGVSPKKMALRAGHLKIATFLAGKSQKRMSALIPPTHWETKNLLQGDLLRHREQWKEAEQHYQEIFQRAEERDDLPLQISTLKKLGDVMLHKNHYIEAAHYYNSAIALRPNSFERLERTERAYATRVLKCEKCLFSPPKIAEKRAALSQMRKEAIAALTREAPSHEIMANITNVTKTITCVLIRECFQVLETPPCQYAIVGLGPMSKTEMNLYSDFKIGIFVEKDTPMVREYFLKLMHLLELKTINLGESYCPILKKGKKSATLKGFTLNRIFSPLERGDLLGTPQDTARIQKTDSDVILTSILKRVCFLEGTDSLVIEYEQAIMNEEKAHILLTLKRDLIALKPALDPKETASEWLDLRNLYRLPSEAIEQLCCYFGITEKDTWKCMEALQNLCVFRKEDHDNLHQAMEFIHGLRIRAHAYCQQEQEVVYCPAENTTSKESFYQLNPQERKNLLTTQEILLKLHGTLLAFCENPKILRPYSVCHKSVQRETIAGRKKLLHYQNLFERARAENDLFQQITCLTQMGNIYRFTRHIFKAISCYNATLILLEKALKDIAYNAAQKQLLEKQREGLFQQLEHIEGQNLTSIKEKRAKLTQIREKLRGALSGKEPIPTILETLTEGAKSLIKVLLRECFHASKPPPCQYAIIALGAMASNEMGPYSEVKFAVLLEENTENNRVYFLHLIKLFEIKMATLGKTKNGILGEEERFAEQGFHFGNSNPLRKKELLDTPENMAAIQGSNAIGALLQTSVLLDGNVALFETYKEKIAQTWSNPTQALTSLEKTLAIFEPELRPKLLEKESPERLPAFNPQKQLYYLFSELIRQLCLYYDIRKQTTWERLKNLKENGILNEEAYKNLWNATTGIMRLTLRIQLYYKTKESYLWGKNESEHFELRTEDITMLTHSYRTLFPFYKELMTFCAQQKEPTTFRKNPLQDRKYIAKGMVSERLKTHTTNAYHKALQQNPKELIAKMGRGKSLIYSGNRQEVIEYYQKLITYIKKHQGSDSIEIAHVMEDLGVLLHDSGQYKSAIANYYEPALIIKKRLLGDNHLDTARSLIHLALSQRKLEEFEKAISSYHQVLSIYVAYYHEEHPLIAKILICLGIAYANLTKWETTVELFEKALHINIMAHGITHFEVARIFTKLGIAWENRQDYAQAKKYYYKAMQSYWATYGKNPPNCIKKGYNKTETAYGQILEMYQVLSESLVIRNAAARLLQKNSSETSLDLSGKKLQPKEIGVLAKILAHNRSLQRLNLGYNCIGNTEIGYLTDPIAFLLPNLLELNLCHNNIDKVAAATMAKMLKANHTLKVLDLSKNKIGNEGLRFLAEALCSKENLQYLYLSDNQLGRINDPSATESLQSTFQFKEDLFHICSYDIGMQNLAILLEKNQTLQGLDLSKNELSTTNIQLLLGALEHNKSLKELDLGTNKIRREGSKVLSDFLKKNPPLQTLLLASNKIDDSAAKLLATSLSHNTHLRVLDLFKNKIGPEGIQALGVALKNNQTLYYLGLSLNPIGEEGATMLKQIQESLDRNRANTS